MKTTKPNWNMRKLSRMEELGTLRFDYPIQRKGGQWDALQQSLLIHSIAGDFPVPPILVLKGTKDEVEVDFVLDGKQRTTTVLNYISGVKNEEGEYPSNAYPLHADTPTVTIEGKEEEIEVAGKYFDELHEDIQTEILSANFQVQRLEDATDEEIEELFFRWNNGTPLTKQQKARAKMGVTNALVIDSLQKHSFLNDSRKFTALQLRRSDDEAVVLQTLILMSGREIESLVADKLLQFATDIRDTDITDIAKALKDALDYANQKDIVSPIFKKLHLPTLLLVSKYAKDNNVPFAVFEAWVNDFSMAIHYKNKDKALVKTKYKQYMGAGSVKKDKVIGRQKEMLAHFKKFVEKYEMPKVEAVDEVTNDSIKELDNIKDVLGQIEESNAENQAVENQEVEAVEVVSTVEFIDEITEAEAI